MLTKASLAPSFDGREGRSPPRRDGPRLRRRPFRARPVLAATAVVITVAALLAGCGGPGANGEAGKAAGRIVTDAQKATMSASSVHVSGSGTTTTTPLKLDLIAGPGRGGGTITSGTSVLNLILDKQSIYIKADAATIQSLSGNAATASRDANKWLQTSSTSSGFTGLSQLLDITRLPQSFTFGGVPAKQSATTFAGMAVIPVFDPKSGGTLYVATTGKPYIIGIKGAKSNGGATLTFDHYGTAKVPSAPPNPITLPTTPG
ncbi:MAG: hypothetical protein ACR2MN_14365 [Acidimicrobiales bacterium]